MRSPTIAPTPTIRSTTPEGSAPRDADAVLRPRDQIATSILFYIGLVGLSATYAVLFLAAWAVVPAFIPGWQSVVITSGSMSPSIRTGDVVVVKPSDGQGLSPGSVVVISDPAASGLVTHRIVSINPDGSYGTRGDANTQPDSTALRPDQVVGVGRLRVPFIGLPLVWYRTGAWEELALWATGTLLALWVARYVLLDVYEPWARPEGKDHGRG